MRRAFSILELAISLAIAGIVVAAAASAGVVVTKLLKLEGKKSAADQDARRLVDFVLSDLQTVGGGQVRPWMSLWVENNPTAGRDGLPTPNPDEPNDRVTLIDVDFNRGSCDVVAVSSNTITFEHLPAPPGSPDPGPCCYAWDAPPISGPADQYVDQPLMFVKGRDEWAVRYATSEVDATNCVYGHSGVNPLADWTGTAGAVPVLDGDFETTFATDSTVTPISIRTLYVDEDDGGVDRLPRLMEWVDRNNNAILDDGDDNSVVFPGVLSFHVALGYDAAPDDGRITDSGDTADEWVGNASGDTQAGLPGASQRMAAVGVITGVKAVEPGTRTMQVLDGPAITSSNRILRRASGRALLRNVAVFY